MESEDSILCKCEAVVRQSQQPVVICQQWKKVALRAPPSYSDAGAHALEMCAGWGKKMLKGCLLLLHAFYWVRKVTRIIDICVNLYIHIITPRV